MKNNYEVGCLIFNIVSGTCWKIVHIEGDKFLRERICLSDRNTELTLAMNDQFPVGSIDQDSFSDADSYLYKSTWKLFPKGTNLLALYALYKRGSSDE